VHDAIPDYTWLGQVGLTPRILLGATTQELQNNFTPRCNKKKTRKQKKPGDVSASKTNVIDKLSALWRTMHHLGQPMLPALIVKQLALDLRSMHEDVLMKERLLLKERYPSYPVLMAKVPTGFGFVTTYPADLMIIRYEGIFGLFHMHRLERNLVRLVSLSMAHDIVTDNTPHIAIMDPST
jgi:hypothetical protein